MHRIWKRSRDLLRRRALVAAFDEEAKFHLEELTAEYRRRGYAEAEARAAAQREFGNLTRAREDLREQAGWPALDEWGRDFGLALRGLRRRPLFTIGTALIVAFGVAAALVVLVLAETVFFRPMPVERPDELYLLQSTTPEPSLVSAGTARRLETLLPEGVGLAAHALPSSVTVRRENAAAERAEVQLVVGDFFGVLGLQPVAGRLLRREDDNLPEAMAGDTVGGGESDGEAMVAVAGEQWAAARFGSAVEAVGRTLWLNGQPVTIVGIVPQAFAGLILGDRTHLWLPARAARLIPAAGMVDTFSGDDRPNAADWNLEERVSWLHLLVRAPRGLVGRIHSSVTAAARPAVEDLSLGMTDPTERRRLAQQTWRLQSVPGGYSEFRSRFGSELMMMSAIVLTLLLLTAANVSGLLLVRTLARQRELGVRLALGSGAWRLGRLVVTESGLLVLVGVGLGVLLALWSLPAAAAILAPGAELTLEFFRPRPLLGLAAVAGMMTLLVGLVPVIWITRLQPLESLGAPQASTQRPLRIGRMLVSLQFGLAVLLLALATSLALDLRRVLDGDPGFERSRVLTLSFDDTAAGYATENVSRLYERLTLELRAVPGVVDVGLSRNGILSGSVQRSGFYPRGDVRLDFDRVQNDEVGPGYLEVVGLTLRQGRTFWPSDTKDSPRVAIVNEALARRFFGRADVVGERFGFGRQPQEDDMTIVGVVADLRVNSALGEPPPMFFRPAAQFSNRLQYLAVRTAGPAAPVAPSLREELHRIEPEIVWGRWQTLGERLKNTVKGRLDTTRLVLGLSGSALILAALGIGVSLAYMVGLRRREIAIRLALGAEPRRVVRGIYGDAWRLAGIGAATGLAVTLIAAQLPLLRGLLPGGLDAVAAILAIAAAIAAASAGAWRPARQAVQTDPLSLLKSD
jgi:putative ABC transport system permease protein